MAKDDLRGRPKSPASLLEDALRNGTFKAATFHKALNDLIRLGGCDARLAESLIRNAIRNGWVKGEQQRLAIKRLADLQAGILEDRTAEDEDDAEKVENDPEHVATEESSEAGDGDIKKIAPGKKTSVINKGFVLLQEELKRKTEGKWVEPPSAPEPEWLKKANADSDRLMHEREIEDAKTPRDREADEEARKAQEAAETHKRTLQVFEASVFLKFQDFVNYLRDYNSDAHIRGYRVNGQILDDRGQTVPSDPCLQPNLVFDIKPAPHAGMVLAEKFDGVFWQDKEGSAPPPEPKAIADPGFTSFPKTDGDDDYQTHVKAMYNLGRHSVPKVQKQTEPKGLDKIVREVQRTNETFQGLSVGTPRRGWNGEPSVCGSTLKSK